MITLVCTKCSTTLNVDDGFAGGVCRCSKCGTIQTVPKIGEQSAGGEAIFERASRNSDRHLEALGDIVTSSGLAGSGMLRQTRRTNVGVGVEVQKRKPILAAILGASVVLLAGGLWVVFHMNSDEPSKDLGPITYADPESDPRAKAKTKIAGPSFGPIALDAGGAVIYLVDRGDATRAFTASLQQAVLRSVTTLGANRKFQVRYWTADGESPAFPTTPAEASAANVGRLGGWMADVAGGRATDATDSLDGALATKPGEIVILTGKAWQLDDAFANDATIKLSSAKVRVHGVALGGSTGSDALARIASKTGGTFVDMDEPTLAAIAK